MAFYMSAQVHHSCSLFSEAVAIFFVRQIQIKVAIFLPLISCALEQKLKI